NKYKDAAQKIADKSFANNNLRTAKVMQDTVNFMQDVQDRVNQNQSEMTEDGFVKENVVKQKQSDLDLETLDTLLCRENFCCEKSHKLNYWKGWCRHTTQARSATWLCRFTTKGNWNKKRTA